MPCKVSNYIENKILFTKYWGKLTIEEVKASMEEINSYLEQSEEPIVHIISDVGDVTQTLPLSDVLKMSRGMDSPSNAGWSIIIREKNKISKFVATAATSFRKQRMRHLDTFEDAKAFLANMDPTVDWHKADEGIFKDFDQLAL